MLFRFLVIVIFFITNVLAESKIQTKIEAGVYLPNIDGSIKNTTSSFSFRDDNAYEKAPASYFALDIGIDYDYVPNVRVDYFYMQANQVAMLSKSVVIAKETFSSDISSVLDFNVLNTVVYQDFKQKGKIFSLFGKKLYTGDIEFDTGLNIKYILWHFTIQNETNLASKPSWIEVNQFIPLPYLGFRYYLYNSSFYSSISALSFIEAKSLNYHVGVSYKVTRKLSLNAAYLYERFEAVEKDDIVKFSTKGYKFGFTYTF